MLPGRAQYNFLLVHSEASDGENENEGKQRHVTAVEVCVQGIQSGHIKTHRGRLAPGDEEKFEQVKATTSLHVDKSVIFQLDMASVCSTTTGTN
jgi:hypothetical protein